MKYFVIQIGLIVCLILALIPGCGTQGSGGGSSTITFTVSPMSAGDYKSVGPMGNLNPRMGHALPTDHGGFAFTQNTAGIFYTVYAPAAGTISEITYTESSWPAGSGQTGTYRDWQIKIRHNYDFYSIFGHMSSVEASILAQAGTLSPNVSNQVSIAVSAGQAIGACGSRPGVVTGMDWYVTDYLSAAKSFINSERYGRMRYSTHFLDYCTTALKNTYTPLLFNPDENPIVTREASPLGGKIDFDSAGKLCGNWFHNSIITTEAAFNEYNKQLAFVYDQYDPTKLRVTFGGPEGAVGSSTVSTPLGLWVTTYQVENNRPDPATVNAASGETTYLLQGLTINNEQTFEATLLVRLNSNDTLSIEGFSGHLSNPGFTGNVQTYTR
jgi:hypothetical protein